MSKGLKGCLAIGVVLMLAVAVIGWFAVVRPLMQVGGELFEASQQWMRIAELDDAVRNTASYSPPTQHRLEAGSVQRFAAVQSAIEQAIGDDWPKLQAKYQDLAGQVEDESHEPTVQELFGGFKEFGGIMLVAKQAQVDALNAHDMSLEEYRYLRQLAYLSVGLPIDGFDEDDDVESEDDPAPQDEAPAIVLEADVAAHNAELLRPHAELLQRTLSTAWLGF
jgi:hypothetical protein